MIKYISLYKDDVAGTFDYFGCFNNVELAKRAFVSACSGSGVPASDLSLYIAGTINTDSGCVDNNDDSLGKFPYYVMRGSTE